MNITNLKRAARAERAAEQARAASEQEWRHAWWATTSGLGEMPGAEAVAVVADTLGQSKTWINKRRNCGRFFSVVAESERIELPPTLALYAVLEGGNDLDPALVVELLLQAEHEGASTREFYAMLTGQSKSTTSTPPKDLTKQQRINIAREELRQRPHEVLEDEEARAAAADADLDIRVRQGPPPLHPDHQKNVMNEFDKNMARALGIDIPTQHLRTAESELLMAMFTRDIHEVNDEAAWDEALNKAEIALRRVKGDAKKHEAWTADDRRMAQELGLNL